MYILISFLFAPDMLFELVRMNWFVFVAWRMFFSCGTDACRPFHEVRMATGGGKERINNQPLQPAPAYLPRVRWCAPPCLLCCPFLSCFLFCLIVRSAVFVCFRAPFHRSVACRLPYRSGRVPFTKEKNAAIRITTNRIGGQRDITHTAHNIHRQPTGNPTHIPLRHRHTGPSVPPLPPFADRIGSVDSARPFLFLIVCVVRASDEPFCHPPTHTAPHSAPHTHHAIHHACYPHRYAMHPLTRHRRL